MACNPSPLFLVFSVSLAMVAVSSCGGGGGGGIAAAPSGPPRLQIEQPPIEISAIETEASPQIAQVSGFDVLSTGVSGSGIGVAVLDTGIMASHSEFGGRVRPGDDLQGDGDGTRDGNGHGTHAASLLAASGDGKGMLGIAPGATLYSYRILNDQGVFGGRSGNLMVPAVLGQVGEHGLPVVNNSWASIYEINDLSRTTIAAALAGELTAYRQLATDDGAILVWAAGNGADSEVSVRSGLPYHFPELKPNWLTVVATDIHGREPRYTNQCGVAAAWCVTAPGGGDDQDREGLIGAALDGDYTRKSGTSMAAPIVSGALAVLMDRFPGLTPRQARDRLIATASLDGLTTATGCTLEGCGEAALRQVFGHGMINLGAALQPITPAALIASNGESNPRKTLMLAPSLTGPALTDSLSGAIAVIRDDFDGRHFSLPLPAFVAAAPAASSEGRFRYSRLFDGRFGRGPGQGGTVALFGLGGAIPAERNLPARLIDIPGPASEAWVGYGLDLGEDEHGPWLRVGFGSGAARQSLHLMLADRATMTRWAGIGGDLSSSWLDGDGRGGLGVGESQSVWLFGGVQKDLGLLHLTVEGLTGQTRMAGAEASLIRAAAIDFDAAAVQLSSRASTDEGWSLSLDLPPALREGWIDLDHPTAVSADGISFARRRHDLDLKTREWRSTVQWARQTEAGLNYRLRLSHARNRGHHDGVEETSASVSLVLPF